MGRAEDYRKRATKLNNSIKRRRAKLQKPMIAKQKALRDMADNEDWLDGKPGTGILHGTFDDPKATVAEVERQDEEGQRVAVSCDGDIWDIVAHQLVKKLAQ